ncbi:MAG: acireductone synthase [Candidatus Caenarcaniphilales bacterium]|nr:acireductone synthase [Candidatus Caenarcaniphilales bacterium]
MIDSIKAVLIDIEGTIAPIRFVHEVLFPYARERIDSFLTTHQQSSKIKPLLDALAERLTSEYGYIPPLNKVISTLKAWIDQDRKDFILKVFQGMIWEQGFSQGDFKGMIYPDVPVCLKKWSERGITLAIYSSGSVQAQKLYLRYSDQGDLTALFSQHFDTAIGSKKDPFSYVKIAQSFELEPGQILFLSDLEDELLAAQKSDYQVTQLVRDEQTKASITLRRATNFHEIQI